MDSSLWHIEHGLTLPWLMGLGDKSVDHVIADPPYSAYTHSKSRSGRNLPDAKDFSCRARRAVDFGFDHLTKEVMETLAKEYARLSKRWVLVFCDVESVHLWREALVAAKLDYVRTMAWVKQGGTPQFTGDRPAVGFEAIVVAHPKGRKKWNGGGKAGIYFHPVVQNRKGQQGSRMHTTQKPVPLMIDLVSDFTSPNDLILDSHAGSGTTGVAALRLGRRFLGCEMQPRHDHPEDMNYVHEARERLAAEQVNLTYADWKRGQVPLFG